MVMVFSGYEQFECYMYGWQPAASWYTFQSSSLTPLFFFVFLFVCFRSLVCFAMNVQVKGYGRLVEEQCLPTAYIALTVCEA